MPLQIKFCQNGRVTQFLGPNAGSVGLDTWEQVVSAAAGGLLEENLWCELKEMLAPSNAKSNIELAKDLASLSVHGGALIIGVIDKTYEVTGCDTSTLRDRIAQVASKRIHPPLSPVIHPDVKHPDDPSKAVLVVEVPPSALAPHMVDDKYWGRSSIGKRALSDPEIRELIASRARTTESFQARFARFVSSDHVSRIVEDSTERTGHIYLMAEPCAPVLGRGDDFDLRSAIRSYSGLGSLGRLSYRSADALGQAVSASPGPGQARRPTEIGHLLVTDDDSTIEAMTSGATDHHNDAVHINSSLIACAVVDFYSIVRMLSLTTWGYAGQWRVGIRVQSLRGAVESSTNFGRQDLTYLREHYNSTALITPSVWDEVSPEAKKLLVGFLRAVGKAEWSLHEVIDGQQRRGR